MDRKKALIFYLLACFGHIWAVCIIIAVLNKAGIRTGYFTPIGMVMIGLAGISSALWGAVFTMKYRKIKAADILRDFFGVKQSLTSYLLMIGFLSLDFLSVLFGGSFVIGPWYAPILMFLKHIIFGGIEEIGWRYFFQPVLQEHLSYIPAVLMTFAAWGVWHYSFFYTDGSLPLSDAPEFFLGLLINCFILSALYISTKSLWICVITHSLINVLSQTTTGGNIYVSYICRIIIIIAAVVTAKADRSGKISEPAQ